MRWNVEMFRIHTNIAHMIIFSNRIESKMRFQFALQTLSHVPPRTHTDRNVRSAWAAAVCSTHGVFIFQVYMTTCSALFPFLTDMCIFAGLPLRAKSEETCRMCTNSHYIITYATIWKWNTSSFTIRRKKNVTAKRAATKMTAISQRSVKMNFTHNSQFTCHAIQMTWLAYHSKRFMPILTEMCVLGMLPWHAQTEEMWRLSMFFRE